MTGHLRIPKPVRDAILKFDPNASEDDLSFWELANDEELEQFLVESLLDSLDGGVVDLESLPQGYAPLLYVLEFEYHCQSDGWTAVANEGIDQMRRIAESYRFIGLEEESAALGAVIEAYQGVAEDDKSFHEILGRAYRSVPNRTPDIEGRLPILFAFIRNNPDYFGVHET